MSKTFKILSIDGGGYRGVYAAHILKRIEEEFSVNWRKEFGLITGTSTGSIIASGLAIGFPASKIVDLYEQHGSDIFKKPRIPGGIFFKSKYSNEGLHKTLDCFLGNIKLGDIEIPLIIPATDVGNGCVHVFKSTYHNEFFRDKDVPVSKAVLASCSAPMFFPPVLMSCQKRKYLLADGGVWANNPSLIATIDAKRRLGVNLDDIQILSIGTGITNKFYSIKNFHKKKLFGWGILTLWGREKFIEMILNLQSQTSNNMLGLLLKPEQILRINFDSDIKLPLDATDEFDDLITRADRDFTHKSATIKQFLKSEVEHEQ